MKKLGFIMIFLLFISGCVRPKKEEIKNYDVLFDDSQYQVFTPFKSAVSNNYISNNLLNNYNYAETEDALLNLSKNYFKPINSLYQSGQYISEKQLKELLSNKVLNNDKEIIIDDIKVKPNYVTTIIEQNYLASNGNLKGITLGLVINPYQAYKGLYGSYNHRKINDDILHNVVIDKSNKLIKYVNNIPELKDVKKLIAVYFLSSPHSMLPGAIKYIGLTTNDNLNLNKISYEYHYLKSEHVSNSDINTYNSFTNFEQKLKKAIDSLNLTGRGLYYNNKLQKIDITIYNNTYYKDELLYLTKLVGEELSSNFNDNIYVKLTFKNSNDTIALITKDSNTSKSVVTIIGG